MAKAGRLAITLDGLRQLIKDLHAQGIKPAAILVSEHDKRDIKQEVKALSKQHAKSSEAKDADKRELCLVSGVPVVSHRDCPRGKARVIQRNDVADRNRDVMVR
jgi:hypothetical protein